MKKALLLIILSVAAVTAASAQVQPLKYIAPRHVLTMKDLDIKADTSVSALTRKLNNAVNLKKDTLAQYTSAMKPVYNDVIYSTMPVAGFKSNAHNNMPVLKPGANNNRYNMPVKRIDIVDPTKAKTQPAFAAPLGKE